MGWLNDWLIDLDRVAPKPSAPSVTKLAKPRQPKSEIMMVWFQTHVPFSNDPGGCEAGYYFVSDGVLEYV